MLARGWKYWARDEQKPPPGNWRAWPLAGRGFGKTRTGAEYVWFRFLGRCICIVFSSYQY